MGYDGLWMGWQQLTNHLKPTLFFIIACNLPLIVGDTSEASQDMCRRKFASPSAAVAAKLPCNPCLFKQGKLQNVFQCLEWWDMWGFSTYSQKMCCWECFTFILHARFGLLLGFDCVELDGPSSVGHLAVGRKLGTSKTGWDWMVSYGFLLKNCQNCESSCQCHWFWPISISWPPQ